MDEHQRREFPEALLDAATFENLPGPPSDPARWRVLRHLRVSA
jgi:hypothetical protein